MTKPEIRQAAMELTRFAEQTYSDSPTTIEAIFERAAFAIRQQLEQGAYAVSLDKFWKGTKPHD